MKISSLYADQKLSKVYNNQVKTNYPLVSRFTSEAHDVQVLDDLYTIVSQTADKGGCLIKGILSTDLVDQSRAGSTESDTPTEWVCFDLDGVDAPDIDTFLNQIGCGDTSYILQWSSSAGIKSGLCAHVFMLLDKEQKPDWLKLWLKHLNLTLFSDQLVLSKSGCALLWPLDITTCQNDKLVYVSSPTFINQADPFMGKPRVEMVLKSKQALHIDFPVLTPGSIKEKEYAIIAKLRDGASLPKRKFKTSVHGSMDILDNPEVAIATDMKIERDFVYFNLNGGDSWAYYHPIDKPAFIHNFKGEPVYKTKDILPAYWESIIRRTPNMQEKFFFAFREFKSSDYYNGWYDPLTDELVYARARNERQLQHFLLNHGQVVPDVIPDWDIVWNPLDKLKINVEKKYINIYQASKLELEYTGVTQATCPPTIHKVISHVLGDHKPTIDHFINWLAHIVQTKSVSRTAWIFQGVQGTGKGVLFHQILAPIFGEQNTVAKRFDELQSQFTHFVENKFLIFIDEVELDDKFKTSQVGGKLKNLIVEPTISVRPMYVQSYEVRNFGNYIFASNKRKSLELEEHDRRFNVGVYQHRRIELTTVDIDSRIPEELPAFFAYLKGLSVDSAAAALPLQSEARDTLIELSLNSTETLVSAIKRGDLSFLVDQVPNKANVEPSRLVLYSQYVNTLKSCLHSNKLTRDELFIVFDWCVGGMSPAPNRFTKYLKNYHLDIVQLWKDGKNTKGVQTCWNIDADLAQAIQELT